MNTATHETSSRPCTTRFVVLLSIALVITVGLCAVVAELIQAGTALSALAGGSMVALGGVALMAWMVRSIGSDPRTVPKAWFLATGVLFLVVVGGGPGLIVVAGLDPAAVLLSGFCVYIVTLSFGAWQVPRSLSGPSHHEAQEAAS